MPLFFGFLRVQLLIRISIMKAAKCVQRLVLEINIGHDYGEYTANENHNQAAYIVNRKVKCGFYLIKKGVFKCSNPDAFILVKQLSGAEYAVGFFNLGDSNARIELSFWDMGLPASSGMGLTFRDCLNHMDMGLQTEFYAQTVEPHGCRVFRCKVEAR